MPEHTPAPTPARSIYGFLMYVLSKTVLGIYCAWSFLPDEALHYFNIYYYPQKYWSTAIPIQCLLALTLFAFLIYPSINLIITPSCDNICTIIDKNSITISHDCEEDKIVNICVCEDKSKCIVNKYCLTPKVLRQKTIPSLMDIDIRTVCRSLYFKQ